MTDRFYERMKLLDALEIKIMPDDPEIGKVVNFKWDILGYNTEYIYLQLSLQNPWEVSADGQFDTISVTFWGTEYFKSISNKEVRYGTVLTHKLYRQIPASVADSIDGLDTFDFGFFAFGFSMMLPFSSIGSLLPTWMFVNALQLIAHLPLLNSNMPANAHYFLRKYLDIVRWYNSDVMEKI